MHAIPELWSEEKETAGILDDVVEARDQGGFHGYGWASPSEEANDVQKELDSLFLGLQRILTRFQSLLKKAK
ncbi:hypothetical protein V6N13_033545 [Hibiscus sabdariffa]|uniref:Uncharacterized protein n=1 Tax=Hibiscus sabdariffa TaxID=183260 RepID=A0ABR2FA74_9ROSI